MRTDDSRIAKQAENASIAVDPAELGTSIPDLIPVVPVREEPPAIGIPRVVVLSATNPVLQVLGQDARRRTAIVLAVDNDVYLTATKDLASGMAGNTSGVDGFYLPVGIGIPVPSKSALWAAATTTATSSRISVLTAKDD